MPSLPLFEGGCMKQFSLIAIGVLLVCCLATGCDEDADWTPQEVTDFHLVAEELALHVSWTNPDVRGFEGVELYYRKDSDADYTRFIGTINPGKTIIPSLASTLYHVKIICIYSAPAYTTAGVVKSETVLTDDIPPDVTNIEIVGGINSITISWRNPDIPDFDRVEIEYGILSEGYSDVPDPLDPAHTVVGGLLRATEYSCNFTVFDTQGNTSKGVSQSGSTLPFALRDEGPAGGLLFHVDPSAGDGIYIEAAPADWKGFSNPTSPWATATAAPGMGMNYSEIVISTSDTITSGEDNTFNMVTLHPNPSSFPFAADRCNTLVYGGYDDWFLPSAVQLKAMYDNLHDRPSPLGGFGEATQSVHWASVQDTSRDTYAKALDFGNGLEKNKYKAEAYTVRPVRSFSHVRMVATPTISTNPEGPYLPGTTYTVSITCTTATTSLYYTLDGTEVTEEDTPYTGPFTITTGATTGPPIQAKGFKGNHDPSSTGTLVLSIE